MHAVVDVVHLAVTQCDDLRVYSAANNIRSESMPGPRAPEEWRHSPGPRAPEAIYTHRLLLFGRPLGMDWVGPSW